jgi:flagellar P-ring protein FlgI
MNQRISWMLWALTVALANAAPGHAADVARIKDIARVQGWRTHALVGYGLVTGLAGTGDSQANATTKQTLSNLLAQFNLTLQPTAISSRNVAVVMVSANLATYARPGDTTDVTVSSMGDAKSLVGGTLLLTPLKAVDDQTYVMAQGSLTVGGYEYDANGTLGQKNHPTVATVPGGGLVEVAPPAPQLGRRDSFSLSLIEPDYTNAARMADVINTALGGELAHARDPNDVDVRVPETYRERFVDLVRNIESLEVPTDFRARVVVNERTGTVVSGANVRISQAAISYGDLKISIVTDNTVSQPLLAPGVSLRQQGNAIRTARVANSRVNLQEQDGASFISQEGGTIADLITALGKVHTSTRDVVSILKALKAAGALHAELIVQ